MSIRKQVIAEILRLVVLDKPFWPCETKGSLEIGSLLYTKDLNLITWGRSARFLGNDALLALFSNVDVCRVSWNSMHGARNVFPVWEPFHFIVVSILHDHTHESRGPLIVKSF